MMGAVHMQITTIGLDIAKNVFQVHGIDGNETVVVRKQLRRGKLIATAHYPLARPPDECRNYFAAAGYGPARPGELAKFKTLLRATAARTIPDLWNAIADCRPRRAVAGCSPLVMRLGSSRPDKPSG